MADKIIITGGGPQPDGVQIGSATTEKVGFHGVTPIVQRSGANGTALTDSTGGSVADATLAAVGATNGGDVSAAINANFAKTAELVNELRATLVAYGLHKGSA